VNYDRSANTYGGFRGADGGRIVPGADIEAMMANRRAESENAIPKMEAGPAKPNILRSDSIGAANVGEKAVAHALNSAEGQTSPPGTTLAEQLLGSPLPEMSQSHVVPRDETVGTNDI
jgi:hypothetical protein